MNNKPIQRRISPSASESKSRKLIQMFCFGYGCLGSLSFLLWDLFALFGYTPSADRMWLVLTIAILHGTVGCFTFQTHVRPPWKPLLALTQGRITLAKTVFVLTTLNFFICLGLLVLAKNRANLALENKSAFLILASIMLQNTVYIALHWAFRPENLFPASFIHAIANPLGFLFSDRW